MAWSVHWLLSMVLKAVHVNVLHLWQYVYTLSYQDISMDSRLTIKVNMQILHFCQDSCKVDHQFLSFLEPFRSP